MEGKCKIKKCKRELKAKGYCAVHYTKWRQGEYGKTRYKPCSEEGCTKRRAMGNKCEAHLKKNGDASEETKTEG
ncbi:MAG: hypothetical protein ABIA04_03010 [Pseudomonadota bacterium]